MIKENNWGVPIVAQQVGDRMLCLWGCEFDPWPCSVSGLRTQYWHKLWCRSRKQLRSCVAVVVAWVTAAPLIWPLAWELPYTAGVAIKRKKKKRRNKNIIDKWDFIKAKSVDASKGTIKNMKKEGCGQDAGVETSEHTYFCEHTQTTTLQRNDWWGYPEDLLQQKIVWRITRQVENDTGSSQEPYSQVDGPQMGG